MMTPNGQTFLRGMWGMAEENAECTGVGTLHCGKDLQTRCFWR